MSSPTTGGTCSASRATERRPDDVDHRTDRRDPLMARTFLLRGMLVGLAAGLLAFVFASVFGEPSVNAAIGFEAAHTAPGVAEPEVVSRTVQSTVGLAVAVLIYGAALGGLFGVAYAFAHGRLGRLDARATSLLVA